MCYYWFLLLTVIIQLIVQDALHDKYHDGHCAGSIRRHVRVNLLCGNCFGMLQASVDQPACLNIAKLIT